MSIEFNEILLLRCVFERGACCARECRKILTRERNLGNFARKSCVNAWKRNTGETHGNLATDRMERRSSWAQMPRKSWRVLRRSRIRSWINWFP